MNARQPYPWDDGGRSPLERARARMLATGQWHDSQAMGRRWAVGCVALEITQRCNLDCSLCYLSVNSEAVKDIPLCELFRRIDAIAACFGPGTDVQVTGGDPTLRKRQELLDIVARIRGWDMRPSLFTNGIRLKRNLLEDLVDAGLVDVAFHVDMTQGRKGYTNEVGLNAVRRDCIDKVRGLPLSVFFNTTVFDGNFQEIPAVVDFFVRHSDIVRLASFQLQADTGRGTQRRRGAIITMDSVAHQIEAGANAPITFDAVRAGHAKCNRYAMTLVTNGVVYDIFDDKPFVRRMLAATAGLEFDRTSPRRAMTGLARWFVRHPQVWKAGMSWSLGKLKAMGRDLVAARGRTHKLSFFVHDFMDACRLEKDRIDACAFMVATADGPISMCLHNAKRDDYILRPQRIESRAGPQYWDPLTGHLHDQDPAPTIPAPKVLKGRAKAGAARSSRLEANTTAQADTRPE
jgi:molybdenum cofactor biosynthesis enzyme MoaA